MYTITLVALQNEIKSRDLTDDVTIMVFADHGMYDLRTEPDACIDLLDHINTSDYHRIMGSRSGPIVNVWPNKGGTEKVCDAFVYVFCTI